jgi:hypothetical protein
MRQSGFQEAPSTFSAAPPRYFVYAEPGSREALRFCACKCRRKVTHLGCSNGQVVMTGCEQRVRRWVRDGMRPVPRLPSGAALRQPLRSAGG